MCWNRWRSSAGKAVSIQAKRSSCFTTLYMQNIDSEICIQVLGELGVKGGNLHLLSSDEEGIVDL
jgi:hypothetical protein